MSQAIGETPADGGAVAAQGASVRVTGVDGDEVGHVRRRRRLAGALITPTLDGALRTQTTRVEATRCDLREHAGGSSVIGLG